MTIILASLLKTHSYTENGERIPLALDDENGILSNMKHFLKKRDSLVCVANDPDDFADNDEKLRTVAKSMELSGLGFADCAVLDSRNIRAADKQISAADLIILSGGKCLCQNRFFNTVGMKRLLANSSALVIGISAGAMNLCGTVANFPEAECDLSEPRWFDGMGFYDGVVIPHFDGATKRYQFDCGEIDAVNGYILPMSRERDLVGLPNGSYIILDKGKIKYYGDVYKISNVVVTRLF